MGRRLHLACAAWLLAACVAQQTCAAPDEDALGRAQGYPAAPRITQVYEERYKVGSFSGMDSLAQHCTMPASAQPLPLPRAAAETAFAYRYQGRALTLDRPDGLTKLIIEPESERIRSARRISFSLPSVAARAACVLIFTPMSAWSFTRY